MDGMILVDWKPSHCDWHCLTFIGLFDLPGSQNLTFRPNSLDPIPIDFANERFVASTNPLL